MIRTCFSPGEMCDGFLFILTYISAEQPFVELGGRARC